MFSLCEQAAKVSYEASKIINVRPLKLLETLNDSFQYSVTRRPVLGHARSQTNFGAADVEFDEMLVNVFENVKNYILQNVPLVIYEHVLCYL